VVAGYFVTTTGRRKETLIVMSVGMVAGYVAMTLTGSLGILVPLAILAGATQAYNPLLFSVPFHLPGLKPKQMSVAIAFVMVSISAGTIIGPLIAGYMEEVFGGLKTPLIIVACFGATVCMTGLMLRRQSTSSGSGDTQVMERPLEATPAT
ncbi:MAG: MFS transporter, partial [SAR202 cluster bacterium]|nr:MFS transporter [SAR202 cluster bacterium]